MHASFVLIYSKTGSTWLLRRLQRVRPTLHRAKLLLFYLPETRQQASQAASQQPAPTASGSVVNSVAGVSQSSQSGQSGSSAGSDNLEVFLSFDFVPGFFLYVRV